jgi:hypothetical protein
MPIKKKLNRLDKINLITTEKINMEINLINRIKLQKLIITLKTKMVLMIQEKLMENIYRKK